MNASIMITCLGDLLFPEVGVAMVKLLRRLGVTVDFPQGQTCCGMPLFNSGFHHDAALVAARTVKLFERRRARGGPLRLLRVDGQDGVSGSAQGRPCPQVPGRGAGPEDPRAVAVPRERARGDEHRLVVQGSRDLSRLLPSPARAGRVAEPARRSSAASRAASWWTCPARTNAADSADPSRCGCPRCRRPSSTRSSPTWRARAPIASWPATRAASCR